MKKSGFRATKAMLSRITPKVADHLSKANQENAESIVDVAKVLIPEGSTASRNQIQNTALDDGAQLIDFGPKAKVIEGGPAPRPFVNPALKGTKRKRDQRNRKAIRDAIKAAK